MDCVNKNNNNKETISNKKRDYRQNNKVLIAHRNKEYYENNKQLINAKCECNCGGNYTHKHKARHLKTNRHQQYLGTIDNLTV